MIAIDFRFPGGRYHATPWGSHVNEGRVEWPPSPWRIGRALAAVWYKLASPPDEGIARRVVLALATNPPRYCVPPASAAHTRHYMPNAKSTTKVLDAFVAVSQREQQDGGPRGVLTVGWDLEFSAEEKRALATLVEGLGYLGRAESWVEGSLTTTPVEWNVTPGGPAAGDEVFLWTVLPEAEWLGWRNGYLAGVTAKKKPSLPPTSWDVLTQDTHGLQKAGWSMPPGVRPVRYAMRGELVRVAPRPRATTGTAPDLAWIRLGGAVLPSTSHTTWIAERLRVAAMAWSKGADGLPSPIFSGHVPEGGPAAGQQHAWFFPTDEDGDGRLDHIAVWAPAGFGEREREALAGITQLWGEGDHPLEVILLAFTAASRHMAWRTAATVWHSETPFLCSRHPKRRGDGWKDSVQEQVTRAWQQLWEHRRAWPNPPAGAGEVVPNVRVDIQLRAGPAARAWSAFRTDRPHHASFGALQQHFDLKLTFDRDVFGPLSLGAGAHFGLGRFGPAHR